MLQLSQWPGQDDSPDGPLLLTTALWNVSTQFESKVLHGLTPEELREIGPRLAAEGYRPGLDLGRQRGRSAPG